MSKTMVRCALKWIPQIGVFLKYYGKGIKTSELYMKASRDKTLISGERTTREPSTMHERTNEGVWWVGYVCRKKNLKTTMTRGNNGQKGNNRYRSEREGARHDLSARRGGVKVA